MASVIGPRQTKQGPRWDVRYRVNGRQTSASWATLDTAQRFKVYIEALKGDTERALSLMGQAQERGSDTIRLDDWMERYVTHITGITEGTRRDYLALYRRTWATEGLGRTPIDVLSREDVATALNNLSRRYSPKSLANMQGLLSAALQQAVDDGLIVRNHAKKLKFTRTDHRKVEMMFLTHGQVIELVDAIQEHYRPFVLLLAATGMRFNEATALPVRNVDLEALQLRVTQAWKNVPGGWELGPPKTRRGVRTITLPAEVRGLLQPLLVGRKPDDMVFRTITGRPVRHAAFHERVWRPAMDRLGWPRRPRIHDLRHTHASWLINAGYPLPVIQRRLGHESIQTTVDTYGHLTPDVQSAAAQVAAGVFGELS